ncbi:LamG-like jellyroll fold domain-containing protein [Bacteroidota bacterium]
MLNRILLFIISCSFSAIYSQKVLWHAPLDRINQVTLDLPPDKPKIYTTPEIISGTTLTIQGFHNKILGVVESGLLLDGFTSYLAYDEILDIPKGLSFKAEGYLAVGAYPTNWSALVTQTNRDNEGFFLGVNEMGKVGFFLNIDGKWDSIITDKSIKLYEWTHLCGIYEKGNYIALSINGELTVSKSKSGTFIPAKEKIIAGRSPFKTKPVGTIRSHGSETVYHYIDGLIDDIKLTVDIKKMEPDFQKELFENAQIPLKIRTLPPVHETETDFGAYYTKLEYYEGWDSYWRTSDDPDVVVSFDRLPVKFVFWRGTSYIPHWVSENGIWYNNEFTETWGDLGCHEPMSDKQCRHSHVRIIENSPARVVVHWRYALVDNLYNIGQVDPISGWGDWADEYYFLYPDGFGIRRIELHSSIPEGPHEWHESIVTMGPGQNPEKVLDPVGLTLVNSKAQMHHYSWDKNKISNTTYIRNINNSRKDIGWTERNSIWLEEPKDANIHIINIKSKYKPVAIFDPLDNPLFDVYTGEYRREVSMYPWWNHWPATLMPSDGRYAQVDDRASHSSLTHAYWNFTKLENELGMKVMIHGMYNGNIDDLVNLSNSWSFYPGFEFTGLDDMKYMKEERAFYLKTRSFISSIQIKFYASKKHPLYNPAFVIDGMDKEPSYILVNSVKIPEYRYETGIIRELQVSKVIVWMDLQRIDKTTIEFHF